MTLYNFFEILFFLFDSLISYILLFDLKYASHTPTLSPRCEMFVDYVYEDILKLHQITLGEIEAHEHQNEAMEVDGVSVTEETKKLERMAKTGLIFICFPNYWTTSSQDTCH